MLKMVSHGICIFYKWWWKVQIHVVVFFYFDEKCKSLSTLHLRIPAGNIQFMREESVSENSGKH